MKKIIVLYILLCTTALFISAQAQIIGQITNFSPCQCVQNETKRDMKKGFFMTCGQIKDVISWEAWENEFICEKILFTDLQFNVSNSEDAAFYSFAAIALQPLRIINSDYSINLTPCNVTNTELKITVSKKHGIKHYERGFDYQDFNRSTYSYFEVLMTITGATMEEVLIEAHNRLIELSARWNEQYFIEYIHRINSKYNIEILIPDNPSNVSWNTISNTIVETLQENDIDLEHFILNEFIFDKYIEGTERVVSEETSNLEWLFFKWLGYFSISDIDRLIYPQMNATFDTKQIGIEISTDIIQHWDNTKNKNNMPQQAIILANLYEIPTYSNTNGLNVNIQNICPSTYRISGTDILFSFSNAQFEHSQVSSWRDNYDWRNDYDMSGFRIADAIFQIPYKNGWIMAKGKNISLNNHIISGNIEFQIDKRQTSGTYIITNTDKGEIIEIPIETLKKMFLRSGMNVEFQGNDDSFIVVFAQSMDTL